MKIHSTAIVDPAAQIGADVEIGPYSVVGPDVKIGDKTVVQQRVPAGPGEALAHGRARGSAVIGAAGTG